MNTLQQLPAGQDISTDEDSVPNRLGCMDYPTGIITGDRHAFFDGCLSSRIPSNNDSKIAVIRTKVDGMSDFSQAKGPAQ